MKTLIALTLTAALLLPSIAFAGSATDAALGLGAFAVFNQIGGGTGIFQRGPAVREVVVAQPVQETVVYQPYPVYQAYPVYEPYPVYQPYPVYYSPTPQPVFVERSHWCPPGQAKKGRC